jgi:sugar transferase EpsL
LKRTIDFMSALALLVIFMPLILTVAALVRFNLGSPILFFQARPGLGGRIFTIYKFRTMSILSDDAGFPRSDPERLTPLGRWLRATSLDELPELWNVVRGDMSLVGPRPLLVEYLTRYSRDEARRHEIRPGITGWAQINGRNATSWEKRLRLDLWYVDHQNLWLDFRILARTAAQVLRREGISAPGSETMHEFRPPSRET